MPHNLSEIINWQQRYQKAESFLAQKGWPDNRDEAWKYTSLAHLQEASFQLPEQDNSGQNQLALDGVVIAIQAGKALVPTKDSLPKGVRITDISSDDTARATIFNRLSDNHILPALNIVHQTGAIAVDIEVPEQADDHMPALIFHFTGGQEKEAGYPFIVVRLHAGTKARIAEIHRSEMGLSCPLMVYEVGDKAKLHHIRLQADSRQTTHLGLNHLQMGHKSQLNSFAISMGGALSRLETHSLFQASDSQLSQSAIYLGQARQHHDITSFVGHEMPDCTSRQIIRGVLDDKARGVFQGKVRVAPDAQKTDGQQMSRALLLSRDAEADAKPELEIFADDVVCAHGATVGELDEDLLFYLKSRGISQTDARDMLIDAFLADALEEIEDPSFAAFLQAQIANWSQNRK